MEKNLRTGTPNRLYQIRALGGLPAARKIPASETLHVSRFLG